MGLWLRMVATKKAHLDVIFAKRDGDRPPRHRLCCSRVRQPAPTHALGAAPMRLIGAAGDKSTMPSEQRLAGSASGDERSSKARDASGSRPASALKELGAVCYAPSPLTWPGPPDAALKRQPYPRPGTTASPVFSVTVKDAKAREVKGQFDWAMVNSAEIFIPRRAGRVNGTRQA